MSVEAGRKAPDFTAPTDGGKKLKLSELRGKPVVLYFYPKDDTSGCTAEACGFRDALPDFSKVKAQVIGVSKDSVERHDKFKKKYSLSFPLVCDEDGRLEGVISLSDIAETEDEEIAGRTLREVSSREVGHPHAP